MKRKTFRLLVRPLRITRLSSRLRRPLSLLARRLHRNDRTNRNKFTLFVDAKLTRTHRMMIRTRSLYSEFIDFSPHRYVGFCFSLCTRCSMPATPPPQPPPPPPLILLHSSYTTHLTPLILHNSSYTTHLTPLILHNSSYSTHLTPLILHNSSYTTHLTQLILLHSSYTTHLTQLILHHSSHTTHLTPLITHSSSTTHLTQLIKSSHLAQLILHNSSYSTHLTQLISHHSSHLTLLITSTHLTQLTLHDSSHTTHYIHSSGRADFAAGTALCEPGAQISWQAQYRAFRRTGWTRGRRWAAAACRADFVAGTLILHHSSHTTHLPPLITHNSSHATHHTPLITHHSSHTTHLTPLITHHSSHSLLSSSIFPSSFLISLYFSLIVLTSLTCGVIRSFYSLV